MTTIASGSAWCGHLTVTQEKQVGSNPIGAAKCSFFEHKLCKKRTFGFSKIDPVTQLVEYYTFNVRVMGSSPIGVTRSIYEFCRNPLMEKLVNSSHLKCDAQ